MLRRAIVAFALCALLPGAALAQVRSGVGPRVGFSVDPDQLVLGGQMIVGEVAPNLTFDPNLELGFGDDVTVVAANFDLHYHFDVPDMTWRPYAGFGLGINFIDWDGGDETEVGGNVILGAGVPTSAGNRFFGELKFGLGDIPELKLMVGWNFRM